MGRTYRIKSFDSFYHVIVRGISGIPIFNDDIDKDKYLSFIKKYQIKSGFKVYAFCLMTTHGHFLIDANGADISKIMHGINQSFAQYFNNKYDRHGPVFQDRFKSRVIDNERYLFILTAYIHNNPKDIPGFKACPEKYLYSSLGIYLGLRDDLYNIVDYKFIMGFFNDNVKKAREKYYTYVMKCDDKYMKSHYDFKDDKEEYKRERFVQERNFKPEDVIKFVSGYTNSDEKMLKWKYNRKTKEYRALCIFLLRYFCNFSSKEICSITGDLTLARISELSNIGFYLIQNNKKYARIMEDFINESAHF